VKPLGRISRLSALTACSGGALQTRALTAVPEEIRTALAILTGLSAAGYRRPAVSRHPGDAPQPYCQFSTSRVKYAVSSRTTPKPGALL